MKTPITLITGYLGAGKTTLLRRIIERSERKIAILMNEFGQIGIDTKIVRGKNIDIMELKGGCVCCSLTGEFEAAIKEIRQSIKPEIIVIETTGVAEPDAIVGDITENIEGVRLDAVITVVDADSMLKYPSLGHTGRVQIEMADIILLNKTDLVKKEELDSIKNIINHINPKATMIETVRCEVDIELILDTGLAKLSGKKTVDHTHLESSKIGHFIYTTKNNLAKGMLEEVLMDIPADVVRAKGFVMTEEGPLLMNFVFGRYEFEPFDAEETELVFIGTNINKHKDKIIERLKECEII